MGCGQSLDLIARSSEEQPLDKKLESTSKAFESAEKTNTDATPVKEEATRDESEGKIEDDNLDEEKRAGLKVMGEKEETNKVESEAPKTDVEEKEVEKVKEAAVEEAAEEDDTFDEKGLLVTAATAEEPYDETSDNLKGKIDEEKDAGEAVQEEADEETTEKDGEDDDNEAKDKEGAEEEETVNVKKSERNN